MTGDLHFRLTSVNRALARLGAEVQHVVSLASLQHHELLAWVEHQEGRLHEFVGDVEFAAYVAAVDATAAELTATRRSA